MSTQLQIPCLGRPFSLGMFYDCRSEKLIPGITLWDADKLKSFMNTSKQPSSKCEIIAEDTIESKSVSLGIEANLKLSFMCGLLTVDGAAKYLNDTRTSKKQSRVTLQYKSTTHFEQLTMEQIGNIQYRDVLADQDATHVVTGISYGADAFFVFDRSINESEKIDDVHGNMEAAVKSITSLSASGSGSLDYDNSENEETDKFHCTFHGDLILRSNPANYRDAIKLYTELPSLLEKAGSVPKLVYLSPLSKMQGGKGQQMVQSISFDLISQIEEIMEHFHGAEMSLNDLLKHSICSKFVKIKTQLSKTKKLLTRFKMKIVENLTEILPRIRCAGAEDKELADLISSINESPFNSDEMGKYIMEKEGEIEQITQYLSNMQKVANILLDFPDTNCNLNTLLANIELKYVVCFAFNVTSESSTYTKGLECYLQTGQLGTSSDIEWYSNPEIMTELRTKSRKFINFVKDNSNGNNIKFVVTCSRRGSKLSSPSVTLYINGTQMPFNPPEKPGTPQVTGKTMNSIDIVWNPSPKSSAISYLVLCTSLSDDSSTQSIPTSQTSCSLCGLSSGIEYQFQIEALDEYKFATKGETTCIKTETDLPVPRLATEFLSSTMYIKPLATPQIYQLPLKLVDQDTKNHLSKYTISLPSTPISALEKPERVLILLGATGAGKSTLLNGLANYLLGVRWTDNFRFKLIRDEGKTSQAKSQTTDITAYTFQCSDVIAEYNLTIVDTPGFGDTDGFDRDRFIAQQIKIFFSGEGKCSISVLHGIGFVTQASLARLTPTQKYIFNSILSIFGKDISDNIFLMATFADADVPQVIESVKVAKIPFKESFKFNNSALLANNQSTESMFNSMFWKMGCTSFDEFFKSFSKAESRSLTLTREVLKEREQLEVLIPSLQEQVRIGISKMDEIQQEERILKQHEAEINANKDFKYEVEMEKFKKVSLKTGIHTTTCRTCNYTCHKDCAYSDDKDKMKCCAMSEGKCMACPNKCDWSFHSNVPYTFEYYKVKETRTSNYLKEKYDTASSGKKRAEAMIAQSEECLLDMHLKVHLLIEKTHQSIKRLQEIALKPNPLTELEYLDLLIKSEEKEASSGWQKRVEKYMEFRKDAELYQKVATSNVDSIDLITPADARPGWKKRLEKYLKLKTDGQSKNIFQRLFGSSAKKESSVDAHRSLVV